MLGNKIVLRISELLHRNCLALCLVLSGPSGTSDNHGYYRPWLNGKARPRRGKSFELECLNPAPTPETCSGCGFL